jgi:hypothetical protein
MPKYAVGDKVLYDGKLCEIKRLAGSMKIVDGIMYKYDLWNIAGGFLYDAISEVEISIV